MKMKKRKLLLLLPIMFIIDIVHVKESKMEVSTNIQNLDSTNKTQNTQKSVQIEKVEKPKIEETKLVSIDKKVIINNPKEGSSIKSINMFETKKADEKPIMDLPNTKQGDSFKVDGPLWYDGSANLKKYDSKSMQFDISMKAAKSVLGFDTNIPYTIKDGKVNLSISIEKKSDGKYVMTTSDNNNNGSKLTNSVSSTEKMVGNKREIVFDAGYGNKTTFLVSKNGDMSIKPKGAPFSLDLYKK